MDLTADFSSYQDRITTSLVKVTRSAAQLSNQDLGFHRSSSDKFSRSLDSQSAHLLRLTNKLLKAASKETSIKPPTLRNRDDIEDSWRKVVDVVDNLLEKADRSLDEFTGVIKRFSPARQDAPDQPLKKPRNGQFGQGIDQLSQDNISKPQLLFNRKVNNFDTEPWKPLLSIKPHANMPLEESIGSGDGGFKHPYAHEIQNMIYPSTVYQIAQPIPFTPIEDSSPILVDTQEGVREMLQDLKAAKEIAIDLEHNDKNSYVGMVCLMQISIRDKDWIIDTLKPWREDLQILNEVFANPRIIKVLHGSTSDIIWLQRDLGLYLVGLFDTYHASNALLFPAKSLKYLLQRFADFEAQKQYQLADWRVRPLPQELIDYARSDTHFLLYIYDNLRNMLVEASAPHDNLVDRVLDASRREALQVYDRPTYDSESGLNPGGWLRMLLQRTTPLSNEQFGVFRAIHEWRDRKARELDEGDQNVVPTAFIWTIAEIMPTYRGAFHQRGVGRLPRYVAENITEIIEVVKQGISNGKAGPSVHEIIDKYGDRVGPMFGRNKYIRRKPEETPRGIAATMQMLNQSGELLQTPANTDLQEATDDASQAIHLVSAGSSQLWGNVDPSPMQRSMNFEIMTQALDTVLPIQDLLQQTFLKPDTAALAQTTVPLVQADPVTNGVSHVQGSEIETFTIKELNKKRKASEMLAEEDTAGHPLEAAGPNGSAMDADELLFDDTSSRNESKRQQKQARKAEKRAKKQADAEARAAAQANVTPFDYANADSVLYARPEANQNGDSSTTKGQNKPLNPFLRALDTSTGARRNRMGKEMPGKSQTFKN